MSGEEKEEGRGYCLEKRMEGRKHEYQMANGPVFPLCVGCWVSPRETFMSDPLQWDSFFWRQVKVLSLLQNEHKGKTEKIGKYWKQSKSSKLEII